MRELKDLIETSDPGINLLRDWASAKGANASTALPADEGLRGQSLLRLQVTTRSILGAGFGADRRVPAMGVSHTCIFAKSSGTSRDLADAACSIRNRKRSV